MAIKQRWMEAIEKDAEDLDIKLPWERGTRRAEMIARRYEAAPAQRVANG